MNYPNTRLLIDGQWCDATDGKTLAVLNPANGREIGRVAHAGIADLERALAAAQRGFEQWRDTSALERSAVMRRAAALMRERAAEIGALDVLLRRREQIGREARGLGRVGEEHGRIFLFRERGANLVGIL